MTLHIGIKQNLNLNELLMELYGEDLRFKTNEIATFTVQATSIRLQDQAEPTIPNETSKRDLVLAQCSNFGILQFDCLSSITHSTFDNLNAYSQVDFFTDLFLHYDDELVELSFADVQT